MAKISLLLFDFDGTLVDTANDLVRTTNLFLESYGHPTLPEERIRADIGYGLKSLIRDVIPEVTESPALAEKIEKDYLAIYEVEMLKTPKIYPGALEFLESWPGKMAIVSNKRHRHIVTILEKLKLSKLSWSAIIGGDTYPSMKPHPMPFLEAMKSAGIDRAETVMVGDGEPDIEGASALKMRSVAVSFGYSPIERLVQLGATTTIRSFAELNVALERI